MKIEDRIKSNVPLKISKKVILNIMTAQNFINERHNDIRNTYNISSEQYNVLRILRGQKGVPANMFLIQDRMIAKTSNTTRLVDKLLLKELVSRKNCPDNLRKVEVSITEKGLEILKILDPVTDELEEKITSNLNSEELEQLNELLEKLITN